MKKTLFYTALILLLACKSYAQYNGNGFAISATYTYTSTAQIFLNPSSADPVTRSISNEVKDIYSYGGELRYRISEPLVIGLGMEVMEATFNGRNLAAGGFSIETEDGYKLIPIEATAYYILPFSTEMFKFFMSAGVGVYFGEYIRNFADVSVTNVNSETAYGIHVGVGFDYMIEDFVSFRTSMKFRDPELDLTSRYDKTEFEIDGRLVRLTNDRFDTKVNVDGVSFIAGLVFHF